MIAVAMAALSSWLTEMYGSHPTHLPRSASPSSALFLAPPRLPLHIRVGLGALTLLLQGIKKLALVESSILIASILLSNEALQAASAASPRPFAPSVRVSNKLNLLVMIAQMGSKQEDASPGTPTPAAEQVISDELDLKVRKYLPGGHANLEGLQDKKLKGQLAVREKLYGQFAKAAAKTEKDQRFYQ